MSRVLIVEDDQSLGKMYERIFGLNGDKVELINNGQIALSRLKDYKNKPDIVILDVIIPGMSGLDVLRNIKEDNNVSDIPVVVLTNSFNKDNEELMTSLGADLYLIKIDNDAKEVVEKVNKLLNKK